MMKKKYMKLIKIFLAVIMVFSQLSNATVVFAKEITDTDIALNNDGNNDGKEGDSGEEDGDQGNNHSE